MNDIYAVLQSLDIPYEKFEHPAVYTVEEAAQHDRAFGAGTCKNLFLRNKKGDTHYLVVAESTRKIDLKQLGDLLGSSKLSFASPERLMEYLSLTPGSVSPFGLINNLDKKVQVIIDEGLLRHEKLSFHPNVNTATLAIQTDDFKKFLEWTGNPVRYTKL